MLIQLEMYDKFGFTTTNLGLVDIGFLENNTEDFKATPFPSGSMLYKCRVRNMRLTMSDYRIKITGSPARFLHGHNFKTLKYYELKQFIEEVSDGFGLDITRLNIYLLDITDNLVMDFQPKIYKRYMGNTRYFERCPYQYNGLYYRNKQHKMLFYDKIIEATYKRRTIPEEFNGLNLWRYEYSILKKVHRKLGIPLVRVTDLLDVDTYINTVNVWERMFNSINLIDVDVRDLAYHPPMTRDNFLLLSGIMANGGLGEVLEDWDQDVQMGKVSYDTANRRKNKYKQLLEEYKEISGDHEGLKEELARKVREKAEENRALTN